MPNEISIWLLMFADEVVLLAQTVRDLQYQLVSGVAHFSTTHEQAQSNRACNIFIIVVLSVL